MATPARSWTIWPLIAGGLAVCFVAWDLTLVGDARKVQQDIGRQVELLGALSSLGSDLDQLSMTHRVDVNTGQRNWSAYRDQLAGKGQRITQRYGTEAAIAGLGPIIHATLHDADSLHQEVLQRKQDLDEQRKAEAVLQIIIKRGQKGIDRITRRVHEEGLGVQTANLSARWDEAQVLLFLACLVAVVFALLVGLNRRLLMESRRRGEDLQQARDRMERINRDLRETMLSKEEKEVMIKEIHHRVKNNLQIVRSLIRFQLDQVEDARVQELFQECVNRVGAMALVHEQTYLSKDLANINVSGYLDSLVRDLISAYNIRLKLRRDIDIRVETLGVDTLIPLGLLINEVISNSFKHAFKDRDAGTIIVHLSGSESAGLHLRIGDDGVGLPDTGKWNKPKSLGMELIQTLAGQLNAAVELQHGPGTLYEMHSMPLQLRRTA